MAPAAGYRRQASMQRPWRAHGLSLWRGRMPLQGGGWRRTFAALGVRNYRLFWSGQVVSLVGTWAQLTGQSWLVAKTLAQPPLVLGTVTMLQFLPVLLFSLPAGVVADRVNKRGLLIATQTAAMLQALALGLLVVTGRVQLWHVCLLAFLLGLINSFDNPVRQAFISEMVGQDLLVNAVALHSIIFNLARIVGPMVAGVSIALVGTGSTFLINAASFVPVLAGLLLMRARELYASPRASEGSLWERLREGISYSLGSPPTFRVLLLMAFIGTFGYNFLVVLPLLARDVLRVESVGFGGMTSAMGVGSILAALFLAYRRRAEESQLFLGAAAFSLLLVLLGLSPWLGASLVLLVAMGFAGVTFTATGNTRLQLLSPPELRGRVLSLYVLLFAGSTPIGGQLLGLAAQHLGVQAAVALFGLVCLLGVGLALLYRRLAPGPAPAPETTDVSGGPLI